MNAREQKAAAKAFVAKWKDQGNEKSDTHSFWIELLHDVYGIEKPTEFIFFEEKVTLMQGDELRKKYKGYIDAMIPETKVMIEQKSLGIDLSKPGLQSDGTSLKPYQQALRYAQELPYSERPRWIVACNFAEFRIYDMERPHSEPVIVLLKDLPKQYPQMQFLVNTRSEIAKKEQAISIEAGNIAGKLYDALKKQYDDPESESTRESLNKLCVRLVFCLYAEDADIFGRRDMFHDYLKTFRDKNIRRALIDLFEVLSTPVEKRDKYMDADLTAFPYVNGGLFEDEKIEIPPFTDEIIDLLMHRASEDFDWSGISPVIFGAIFESTLNDETRRKGGMHYTSIENIHKVIDPLFLNDLKAELETIKQGKQINVKMQRLREFQEKLASLVFFDPACGSGNFLTETYLSLRRLENEALREQLKESDELVLGELLIHVSIKQFYGIEINDFAVTVAKTALWIAEAQMLQETEEIANMNLAFLPLKNYANIVKGNALTMDWGEVVPKDKLNYIMGNPPFVGYSLQSKAQKEDMLRVYVDEKGRPYKKAGKIDYVAGWYFKAAQFITETKIHAAFVSTNSITQGEQVADVWKPLYDRFGIHIDFAHRTFRWDSESTDKAAVHVVIVGFSMMEDGREKQLFSGEQVQLVKNISPYLVDAPTVFIESRKKPLCNVLPIHRGNQPTDGGHLILSDEDRIALLKEEPRAVKYIRRYMMGYEFINNVPRYCLWLVDCPPSELTAMPRVKARVKAVRQMRLESTFKPTRDMADTPTLFREQLNPKHFIAIPKVSSENRRYIPIGYLDDSVIAGDMLFMISDADVYYFGVLTSNVHMAWTRTLCGRLEMRYRYSKDIVYNNFPWPMPTNEQKHAIEQTAQAILDARAKFPDASLADLYDETLMPPELRKAHQENDRAVMQAYGFDSKTMTETQCVEELMKMYQALTK